MIDKSFGEQHRVFDVHIVVPRTVNHQEAAIVIVIIYDLYFVIPHAIKYQENVFVLGILWEMSFVVSRQKYLL